MRFRTPIARTPRISTGNQSALTQGDHRAEGEFWRAAIAHRKFLQPGFSPHVYTSRIIHFSPFYGFTLVTLVTYPKDVQSSTDILLLKHGPPWHALVVSMGPCRFCGQFWR